ncbi:MAG: CsgG/HfaB family protein, partial [Thermodesulfobacteriota bacterium]|nr:CsgG/HfaB family protein [Thermodesulfobacteriota bacterium]
QGHHTIDVEARNLMGGIALRGVIIHVDREGPQIAVEQLRSDHTALGREVAIQGSVYDEAGVSHLSINGRPIPILQGLEVSYVRKLTIDSNTMELAALDRLGNRTSALIDLNAASAMVMVHADPPLSRGRDVYGSASGGGSERLRARHEPVRLASVESPSTYFSMAGLFGQNDTRPPRILLKDWTDTQTVFLNKVYLEGQANDESKIEALSINQVPILRRKGQRVFFSHLAELTEGKNTITIEARDEAGNVAGKEITVIRCVPKALQLAERLSLTVVPFEQKGLVPDFSLSFQDNLIDALVNQGRFNIVERDRLDVILQEHKISHTKLIDRSTALRMGRLTTAQSIIMGNIIETRTGIEIVARMIDTETSEILATEDVYDEVKDLPALRSLAQGMAVKFHKKFHLLEGLVIQQKGNYLFTDLGRDKVGLKTRLIAYSEEPVKHPVTGKILGTDNEIIARARVIQVMQEMSKGEILDGKAAPAKSPSKVITQ